MNKRNQRHDHRNATDEQLMELMKQTEVPLPKDAEKASLNAMAKGVSEARTEATMYKRWQQKRTMFMGVGATVSAAAVAGLILINTDFSPDSSPGGPTEDPPPVDEGEDNHQEESEPDQDEQDHEQNDDERSDAESYSVEAFAEASETNDDQIVFDLSYDGEVWEETFDRVLPANMPIHTLVPEGWETSEESVEGRVSGDRFTIGDVIILDYLEGDSGAADAEMLIEDVMDAEGFDEDDRSEVDEADYPELASSSLPPFDFMEAGYVLEAEGNPDVLIYYGEALGRYLVIRQTVPENEPEMKLYGEAVLEYTGEDLPGKVYQSGLEKDEETGRPTEALLRQLREGDPTESEMTLFTDDELGFSTYIPEGSSVREERGEDVLTYYLSEEDDYESQMSIGIFDEGVTYEEAWHFILDHFSYGENTRQDDGVPDWAVDVYQNMGDMTGSVMLAEQDGRYFYIEYHSEYWEEAAHEQAGMMVLIRDFWRWDDGTPLD